LAEKYGDPIACTWKENDHGSLVCTPTRLNERFFAALLMREGNDLDPAVFDLDENRWLRYCSQGYYRPVKTEGLQEQLDRFLLDVARKCSAPDVNTKPLQFFLRSTKVLSPIVSRASGVACVDGTLWRWPMMILPVANGVLDLAKSILLPHSPDFYFRGVIDVPYEPEARADKWSDFLANAVESDDADLLQRFAGLILSGSNDAQVMVLLLGESASGKGTIARVFTSLIGSANVGTLRTDKLGGRFEIARHWHKRLLYGPDVNEDFLSNTGAPLIKAITGQDPISPEFKNSNATPPAEPLRASVLVTSNSRLKIRFQGDKPAWRRRFIDIEFKREVREGERETNFSEKLVAKEGSGILNWALEGLLKLRNDGGIIKLSERQQRVRDALLDESESSVAFARERLERHERGRVHASDTYEPYVEFCNARGWAAETPHRFEIEIKRAIVDLYGVTQSGDLPTATGQARGWRGIRLRLGWYTPSDEDYESES
jgi:P4 family phage/plasmid primase-like protien